MVNLPHSLIHSPPHVIHAEAHLRPHGEHVHHASLITSPAGAPLPTHASPAAIPVAISEKLVSTHAAQKKREETPRARVRAALNKTNGKGIRYKYLP